MRNKVLYKNIVAGKIVREFEEDYSKRNIDLGVFENLFLKNFNFNILEKENIQGFTYYKTQLDNVVINLTFQNIRNSGIKNDDKKRFQIGNKLPILESDTNSWFVGAYNTGDKIIFVITEDLDFSLKLKNISSISSIWVDFEGLIDCYKYQKSIRDNKNGRRYFFFDSTLFLNKEFVSTIREIMLNSNPNINLNNTNGYILFDEEKYLMIKEEEVIELKRDTNLRNLAIIKAGFKCELCENEQTFIDRNGNMYFEGHHLIPYNYKNQQNFKYLLDTQENIVCLCPNCHKKIHLSSNELIKEMLNKLYVSRRGFLGVFGIKSVNDIINLYNYE